MIKLISLLAILLSVPPVLRAQVPGDLAGRYQMDVQGGDILELHPDGTAIMAGDKTVWSADKRILTVGGDAMAYTLRGNRLLLTMGSVQIAWKKLAGSEKNAARTQKDRKSVV